MAYHREYESRRRKKVSSERARAHILKLKSYGLGAPSIADCCGVSPATVQLIRQGRKPLIYARTEQRILSVTPEGIADSALVDATVTRTLLRELLAEGWSRRDLARALGNKGRLLPMLYRNQVKASMALRVERLYVRAMRGGMTQIPSGVSA
jgi:hypothetical protein